MSSTRHTAFRFQGDDARTSFVNALRRVILAEVPYIATYRDETRGAAVAGGIVVSKNTGRLHNDALVDRIALVPIHVSRKEVEQFVPGSVTVELRVKNDGNLPTDVTSRDLAARLFGRPHPNARTCFPPDPVTGEWPLITRLYPGEEIDVVATLQKGVASTHAAFAVAAVSVAFDLDDAAYEMARGAIVADAALDDEARARALNHCDHITRKRLVARRDDGEPRAHTLDVESQCGLEPGEIVSMAMDVLVKKFTTGSIVFESAPAAAGDGAHAVAIVVHDQGHTFGSVLQDVCMRDRPALGLRSIGYYETHPLENRIVVRVDVQQEGANVNAEDVFARMRAHCARALDAFRTGAGI